MLSCPACGSRPRAPSRSTYAPLSLRHPLLTAASGVLCSDLAHIQSAPIPSSSSTLCFVLEAAANVLHGLNVSLGCRAPRQFVSCAAGGENATNTTGQCVPDHHGYCYDCQHCQQVPGTAKTCVLPKEEKKIFFDDGAPARAVGPRLHDIHAWQ